MAEIDYFEGCDTDAHAQALYVTDATAITTISQTGNSEQWTLGDYLNVEYRPGQSFQLSGASTITGVSIGFKANEGSPSGQVTLRIETDNSGLPSGTLVNANATKTITPTASADNDFNFSTPFILQGSTTYWIVLTCDNQATDVSWNTGNEPANPYANGTMVTSSNGGSSWSVYTNYDMTFKVYSLPLQSFSEATIKTQGSYALKMVAAQTDSLNKTLTRTLGSTIDLSGINTLKFDLRSTRTGSNIKVGIHDSGGTTTELTPSISSANTYETKTWDISGVSDANKDAIDSIIITVTNADSANTCYFDNFVTSFPATVNATAFTLTATGHFPIDIIIIEETLVLTLHNPTVTLSSSVTTTVQELTAALKDPAYYFDFAHTVTAQELTATLGTHAPFLVTRIIRRNYTFGATEQVTYTKLNNFMDTAIWEISNQEAGDMFYYNGSVWYRIPKGTAGQVLTLVDGVPAWA